MKLLRRVMRLAGLSHAPHDAAGEGLTQRSCFQLASLLPTVAEHPRRVREALVRRIRAEFEEMPGLSLTLVQASKLFGIAPDVCAGILGHLIEAGVLRLNSDGRYARRLAPA